MMNCIRDGRSNTGKANFAYAAGVERIEIVVRVIEKGDVDLRAVDIHGYKIVGEAAIDGSATALIVFRRFQHRHANAHDHRTFDLVASGTRVNHAPAINYSDYAVDAQARDLGL